MTISTLCESYLAALNEGDSGKLLQLFTPDATVISPLYGEMDAGRFYRDLFADTARSQTRLRNIFLPSGDATSVALHFEYDWTLKSGKQVHFECVDVFELSADCQRFSKLTIIYDTAPLRADFEASRTEG